MAGETMVVGSTCDIQRRPEQAELELSNAIAAIREALVVLDQYLPEEKVARHIWLHQHKKLKMAIGLCSNVRDRIVRDIAFESLRNAGSASK